MNQVGDKVNQVVAEAGYQLKSWEHWLILVACVCSLILVYFLVYKPNYEGFNEGGTYGVGSHTAHQTVRDDVGFENPSLQYDANGNKMQGFASRRKRSGMSVSGFEPPVFWNAGNYAAVADAQAKGISQEQLDDGSAFSGEGFSSYQPKGYAYDGFASGPDSMPIANVAMGGQPLLPNY